MSELLRNYFKWICRFIQLPFKNIRKEDLKLISQIRLQNLSYLSIKKLISIAEACYDLETEKIPGIFVEAGCALGGSSILIASLKDDSRTQYVYDVFDMIPPPSDEDPSEVHERYNEIKKGESEGINGDLYYGYREDLLKIVKENLREFGIDREQQNVKLIKGLIEETMEIDSPVAFAHIDVDWYGPVKVCLQRLTPKLVTGGVLILDDYNDWGGCKKATDEYFEDKIENFIWDDSAGSLKITRIK